MFRVSSFKPERASQAIPTWTLRLQTWGNRTVSNPNGLPRPFRLGYSSLYYLERCLFQTRTGFPGHSDGALAGKQGNCTTGFKPERASQAIPTTCNLMPRSRELWFQTRTGFPGHSDNV